MMVQKVVHIPTGDGQSAPFERFGYLITLRVIGVNSCYYLPYRKERIAIAQYSTLTSHFREYILRIVRTYFAVKRLVYIGHRRNDFIVTLFISHKDKTAHKEKGRIGHFRAGLGSLGQSSC